MIVLENVRKTYQMGDNVVQALKGVSLRIEQGEFVSLIGASGSGKSTLLHTIGLLDRPDAGRVFIAGSDVSKLSDEELSQLRSETIGFVFQQFHLLKRLTAFENVELPLIYAKGDRPSSDPADLLQRVGLGDRSHHKPNELSGGQQQRVAIARALIRRPGLILADEPTGNLDSQSGKEIMSLLRELHAEGLTVVLVTHEPSIAATADRTIRVHDGEIVEDVRKPGVARPEKPDESLRAHELESTKKFERDLLLLNLRQAGRGLWANKLRTCLSALGIIIGVAAVIIMLALGSGAQESMKKQISALGSNRLMVQPQAQHTAGVKQQNGAVSRLTVDEAMHIDGRIPSVNGVSGMVQGHVQLVYGDKNANTLLQGTMPGYQVVYAASTAYGRFYTLQECVDRAKVAVLGQTVVSELFGAADPVGQWIQVNHTPFLVIGVLVSKGASGGGDADDIILVPLQTAMYRVLGKEYVDWIDVSAASPTLVSQAQEQLLDLTRTWPHIPNVDGDSYQIRNFQAMIDAFSAITKTMALFLACVAAISLVVGGIGIMNIMLVSVTERTREIGLRKALGARGRDIQMQFLMEAVVLCLSGGLLGIALGSGLTFLVSAIENWGLRPTLMSMVLSSGFSVAVGVGFGYWPAVLASRLDPIEALRYE
jgi:macrolide transport system ATP-binding/permease protein